MTQKKSLRYHLALNRPLFFSRRSLAVAAACTLLAIIAGPFGTLESLAPPQRSLFWGGLIGLSLFFGWISKALMSTLFQGRDARLVEVATVVCMSVAFAPVVIGLVFLVNPGLTFDAMPVLPLFLNLFLVISVVCMIRILLVHDLGGGDDGGVQKPCQDPGNEPRGVKLRTLLSDMPPLMRRVPESMRGMILRLEAQDHKVLVTTERGVTPMRLRLADAIDEMGQVQGFRTHRSHWVAEGAIISAEVTRSHKTYVQIRNGDRVPVSRTYRASLEEAGLLSKGDDEVSPHGASEQRAH